MSLEPRKATLSDIPSIIDAYFDAFGDHPINLRVFHPPSSESVRAFWLKSLDRDLHDPNTHFYVITDPTSSSPERVLAFSKWRQPLTPTSSPPPPRLSWPEEADVAFAEEVFGLMDKKQKEIMGDRPHWYLVMLGARKECQRRGAGTKLLRWGLTKADEEGVEAFLTASPAGTPLYQKHGFELLESLLIDDGKRIENFMRRLPQPSHSQP
ncbi:acyl-CoA N-acyltransferase [Hypoxylon rubiginosum]|uniref:Acyl-CoA N-acyltransferase n=1 Tax=Hypoxylon rubiginosum TaxID=110542 RepID=A0ACB9YWK9_9PEZI|nr:acyl-CoA N-acyltransferase [Hypoxylon rubiginosum]